jgi:hypothetical protein
MQMKKTIFVLVLLQCAVLVNVEGQRIISVDYNKVAGKLNTMFKQNARRFCKHTRMVLTRTILMRTYLRHSFKQM